MKFVSKLNFKIFHFNTYSFKSVLKCHYHYLMDGRFWSGKWNSYHVIKVILVSWISFVMLAFFIHWMIVRTFLEYFKVQRNFERPNMQSNIWFIYCNFNIMFCYLKFVTAHGSFRTLQLSRRGVVPSIQAKQECLTIFTLSDLCY